MMRDSEAESASLIGRRAATTAGDGSVQQLQLADSGVPLQFVHFGPKQHMQRLGAGILLRQCELIRLLTSVAL